MTSLFQFETKYFADSVEWCPEGNFLSCGNYQLDEASSPDDTKRKGCLYLIEIIADKIQIHHEVECAGVLDQKWLNPNTLGVANSAGQLQIYEFNTTENKLILKSETAIEEVEKSPIALALDYNSENRVLVSDSLGNVSLFNVDEMQKTFTFSGHSFEAWTCAFDKNQRNVFYSGNFEVLPKFGYDINIFLGGDDSVLNIFDLRDSSKVQQRNNKTHEAGVTSLLTIEGKENHLFTGSYDEKLRIFDTRTFKRPLFEINLRGGIWRIKPNPFDTNLLLLACMYENFSIVRCHSDRFVTELEFTEHESICYGADWAHYSSPKSYYFATCSFYDKKFSLNALSRES